MYKRLTVFSRLHLTTCFTISSWQKCHYYISTFLIKTILIVENLCRSCADLDIFFRQGSRDNCVGWPVEGGGGQSGAYFANYSQCKFNLFEISRESSPPPLFRSAHEDFHSHECQIEKTQGVKIKQLKIYMLFIE